MGFAFKHAILAQGLKQSLALTPNNHLILVKVSVFEDVDKIELNGLFLKLINY